MDPNAAYAELSRWVDFIPTDRDVPEPPPTHVPVLLALRQAGQLKQLRDEGVSIPKAYPDGALHCTARLDADQFKQLKRDGLGGRVARWELQLPLIPRRRQWGGAVPSGFGAPRPPRRPPARKVSRADRPPDGTRGSFAVPDPQANAKPPQSDAEDLIAVIDTGCPFAHSALAGANGITRVLAIWDQDRVDHAFVKLGSKPVHFGYGQEVRRDALARWIDAYRGPSGGVDEQTCYLDAGYDLLEEGFGHGAAILGLAAAPVPREERYPREDDAQHPPRWRATGDRASRADIVFVQLPRDSVRDSSSASLGVCLLDGLRYIAQCAGPKTRRIVVNISDGTSRTLHDGESIIECAMRELVEEQTVGSVPRMQIVIAAGNAHLDMRHARLQPRPRVRPPAKPRRSHEAWLRVPPDCEAPQCLNLRIPNAAAGFVLRLTPPGGGDPIEVHPGQALAWPSQARASLWVALQPVGAGALAAQGLVVWAPTSVISEPTRARGVAGVWQLECWVDALPALADEADVHAWISRNQQNDGSATQRRQARFIDGDGRYDPKAYLRRRECDDPKDPAPSVIERDGSLNGIASFATQPGLFVVSARIERVREGRSPASLYASHGPATAPSKRKVVDGVTCADETREHAGIRVMGNLGGGISRAEGTSFAAPQWARALLDDDEFWKPPKGP